MTEPWIASHVALWLIVIANTVVLLGFLRRAVAALEAAESRLTAGVQMAGAPPGTVVSDFEVRSSEGERVASSELFGSPTVFFFVSGDCVPCKPVLQQLGESGWDASDPPLIAILGDSPANRAVELPRGVTVLYQSDRAAAKAFQSIATPHAFAVDAHGVIVESAIPQSLTDLRRVAHELKGGDERAWSQSAEVLHA